MKFNPQEIVYTDCVILIEIKIELERSLHSILFSYLGVIRNIGVIPIVTNATSVCSTDFVIIK